MISVCWSSRPGANIQVNLMLVGSSGVFWSHIGDITIYTVELNLYTVCIRAVKLCSEISHLCQQLLYFPVASSDSSMYHMATWIWRKITRPCLQAELHSNVLPTALLQKRLGTLWNNWIEKYCVLVKVWIKPFLTPQLIWTHLDLDFNLRLNWGAICVHVHFGCALILYCILLSHFQADCN